MQAGRVRQRSRREREITGETDREIDKKVG